jgi:hypothetical protein
MPAPDIHNERIKLAATGLNNVAVAFAVAGFIAPAASGQIEGAGRFVSGLVWIIIAVGVHAAARALLGRLQ